MAAAFARPSIAGALHYAACPMHTAPQLLPAPVAMPNADKPAGGRVLY